MVRTYRPSGARPGAPDGNRNARRHGFYAAGDRLERLRARALLGQVRLRGGVPAQGAPKTVETTPPREAAFITSEVIDARPAHADDRPMTAQHETNGFGSLLRSWRQTRRLSQLDLALSCGASQRHLSFLESGRARPSRGMALTLGSVLRVPLKDQNLMLLAAGFAPAFQDRSKSTAPRQAIDGALRAVLHQQDPLPALLLESGHRIAAANQGAERLFAFLLGGPRTNDDLGQLFFAPDGVGRYLENADEVIAWSDRQLRAQRILNLTPGEQMISAPATTPRREATTPEGPALTLRFLKDGTRIALYTLLATLGTPLDIGVERLGLEFFLPADDATAAWFRA